MTQVPVTLLQQPAIAVAQPAVIMQPMVMQPMMMGGMGMMGGGGMGMMGGMGAPAQQDMAKDKEFAHLDFNQMKSLVLNTEDGMKMLYEQNRNCEDQCKAWLLCTLTCGGCNLQEFKFKGPETQITYHKPQGCCTVWHATLDSKGNVGKVQKAGCCAGGLVFCIAKYAMCWGTDKYLEMKRVGGREDGKEVFTMRKKLFPAWCCTDILCNQIACVTAPCFSNMAAMFACCKFCGNMEYMSITQPIYGPWGSGNEAVGNITAVRRAVPQNCLCAELEPVRVTMEVPGTTAHGDVANLGFLALVYSDRIPADFQTPKGHPCLDCGLSVKTKWQTFEDMVNGISATSELNSPGSTNSPKK